MGTLEERVRAIVSNAVRGNPDALEASTSGSVDVTAMDLIALTLDKLTGVEDAVYAIAREVDESRA